MQTRSDNFWGFDAWPPPSDGWLNQRHDHPHEQDCHVDLGCGKVKKGRIGIDQFAAPGVNIVMDLNRLEVRSIASEPGYDAPRPYLCTPIGHGLPFPDDSIRSVISHHCLEHIGEGFVALIDEVWRVLEPGGVLRAITPLFPSRAAVDDPTHVRYFTESTWRYCEGWPDNQWHASFSVPYMKARFSIVDQYVTPYRDADREWTEESAREIRVSLIANK